MDRRRKCVRVRLGKNCVIRTNKQGVSRSRIDFQHNFDLFKKIFLQFLWQNWHKKCKIFFPLNYVEKLKIWRKQNQPGNKFYNIWCVYLNIVNMLREILPNIDFLHFQPCQRFAHFTLCLCLNWYFWLRLVCVCVFVSCLELADVLFIYFLNRLFSGTLKQTKNCQSLGFVCFTMLSLKSGLWEHVK